MGRFLFLLFCLVSATAFAEEPEAFYGQIHRMNSAQLRNSPQMLARLRNVPPSPLRMWAVGPHLESSPAVDPAQDPLVPLLMEDFIAARLYSNQEQLDAAWALTQERRAHRRTIRNQSKEAITNAYRVHLWQSLVARYPDATSLQTALQRFFADPRLSDALGKEYLRALREAEMLNAPASPLPAMGMENLVPALQERGRASLADYLRGFYPKADLPKSRFGQAVEACRLRFAAFMLKPL